MGATHSFDSTACLSALSACDCRQQVETISKKQSSQLSTSAATSNKLLSSPIGKTHVSELKKAIAHHEQDLATKDDIYQEMNEIEQRMRIVKPKLQLATPGKREHYDLQDRLSKLQERKVKLAPRLDQYKHKTEEGQDIVKALEKLVAQERDTACALYTTSSYRASTSPRRSTSPEARGRKTSPDAIVRNTSSRRTPPEAKNRSTSPEARVRSSLTDRKLQSVDSLRTTEIDLDLPQEFHLIRHKGARERADGDGAARWQ
jgi:hypothetical protein